MNLPPISVPRTCCLTAVLTCFSSFLVPVRAADYLKDIKPLLHERCYACHGAVKHKGGLRLATAALMLKGGDLHLLLRRRDVRIEHPRTALRLPCLHRQRHGFDFQISASRMWRAMW